MIQFNEVIGQEKAKQRLSFYLEGYEKTSVFPNMLLISAKGIGKSYTARAIGRRLLVKNKPKPFVEINCSTIKNVTNFFDRVVQPHVVDRDVTLFFDEASELPKNLTMALLTILEPNDNYCNSFLFDGIDYFFDFRRCTMILATSEPQKVFHALQSRLDRLDLEDYTPAQLAKILQKGLPSKIVIESKELLEEVAGTLRANARCAAEMARHINRLLKIRQINHFNFEIWEDLKQRLDIQPLGLNQSEIRALKYLARREETSLTTLASKMQLTKEALQRDVELFLLKHDLIEIRQRGRAVTKKGREYLDNLE